MRIAYFIIVLCIHATSFAQKQPVLQFQQSLNGLSEVVTTKGSNSLLLKNNDSYTLLDQHSKIQLGSIFLDLESTGLPGLGKTMLLNDSVFLISTGRCLLSADLLNNQVDTFFNDIQFPEFIINYIQIPGKPHQFLLATKIYTVDKNGYVQTEKTGPGNRRVFDDGKNCRLLLFDSRLKKVIRKVSCNYAITAFAPPENDNSILAGSFNGEIFGIDSMLNSRLILKPFNAAVHSLLQTDNYLVAIPHIAEKFIGANGAGIVYVYNKETKQLRTLQLPKQKPLNEPGRSAAIGPSSDISRIFMTTNTNPAILVNYGFSRLLKLNLKTLDTTALPVPAAAARFYTYNKDSTLLLAARTEKPGIFELQGDILFYDLAQKKFLPSFNKPKEKRSYAGIYKLYDREGNYHFAGHISHSGRNDSLVIFSSNRTEPSFITVPYGEILVYQQDTSISIQRSSVLLYGKLRLEKISQSNYTAIELSPLFEQRLKTEWNEQTDLPYEITRIDEIATDQYLITGYTNKNHKAIYRIVLTDTSGRTKYKTKDFESGISDHITSISADRRYMAYYSMQNDQTILEITDLQKGRTVFSNITPAGKRLYDFAFDIQQPFLWYSEELTADKHHFFQVDCSGTTVSKKQMFTDDRFLSFMTDMDNDLMAAERYDKLMMVRLSDGKILWEEMPLTNYFKISSTANGFLFSTEKEIHEVDQQMNHRYFASFSQFKPAEIMNKLYYKADKGVLENFGFTYQQRAYQAGDFDVYFNRPDLVILSAGSVNKTFNEMLSKAVAKRLRFEQVKDIGTLLANSPSISVTDKQLIPDLISKEEITIQLTAESAGNRKLKAIHIVINGVPLFGKKGSVLLDHPQTVVKEFKIRLTPGINDIQIFASDDAGYVSPSEHLLITADFTPAFSPELHFIGIGINRFTDSSRNLAWSVKDIRDMTGRIHLKYPNARIDTLFDEQVTKQNIIALKKKLHDSRENDKIIIAYSGHGLLDTSFNYYLSTYAVNFDQPEQNGLPYDELENLLDSIPARRKLMLIDACHSGEVDKEEMTRIGNASDSLQQQGTKGGKPTYTGKTTLGMKNSFELMQSLFVNVGKSTGATVISAAAGTQFALERGDLKNGVFTYSVLEALQKSPSVRISELRKMVGERVAQLTNGLQQPTSRNETISADWEL